LPYRDLEKRREYQRNYKRKRRGWTNPDNLWAGYRAYLCAELPSLQLCGDRIKVQFNRCFLVTDRPEEQALVEGHRWFGNRIFPLALALPHPVPGITPKKELASSDAKKGVT
jgi:hypothetical protein